MMWGRVTIWALPAAMLLQGSALGQAPKKRAHEWVDEGNRAFTAEDFEAALEAYELAESSKPDSAEIAFNQAVAKYKLGEYTEAEQLFNKALATGDERIEGRTKYNLGNCHYARALEAQDAPREAIEHLKSAIRRYRDALDVHAEDDDAKKNVDLAQRLIQQLREIQQQQQQQQQDSENQDEQEQGEQDEQSQSGEQDDESEQDRQNQSQREDSEDQNEQQQNQQPRDSQQNQDQNQQPQESQQNARNQQNQSEQREMTPEEAERLLQAVRDRERERREERAARMRVRHVPVLRDW
jgi:Ca-activated chloride channel family protein